MTTMVRFGMYFIDIAGPVRDAARVFKTVHPEKVDELIAVIATQFETGISGWTVRKAIVATEFLNERGIKRPAASIDDLVGYACRAVYREGHRRDFSEAAVRAQASGRVLKVKLVAIEGSWCDRSKEQNGKIFVWRDAPKLPLVGCRNRRHCGCSYMLASSPLGDRPQ